MKKKTSNSTLGIIGLARWAETYLAPLQATGKDIRVVGKTPAAGPSWRRQASGSRQGIS